jgi:hypothetical protein
VGEIDSSEERQKRISRNEAVFRQVNEKLEQLNEAFGELTGTFEIVCECGNADCTSQIAMRRDKYEELRSDPTQFAVVKGHEIPDVEHVVAEEETYDVVRKNPGTPAEVAAATDPRR